MRHTLEAARYTIIGTFLLFLCFMALFALQGHYIGKATVATTVNITPAPPAICHFAPQAGYNIISIPCITTVTLVSNITNGTGIWAIYQYVPGDSDLWRVYNPNLPSYVVSDLQFFTRKAGYIAIMNFSVNETVVGILPASTDVPIAAGWNLVGYPTNVTRNISDSLSSINSSYDLVIAYNKSNEQFISYANPGGGALQYTVPEQGYWINGTVGASWTVTS